MEESITLYNATNMERLSRLEGGEYISGIKFSDSGNYLAAFHTFQGGGFVGIYQVETDALKTLYEFGNEHLGQETPLEDFADAFGRTAFSSDEKSAIVLASNSACDSAWFAELFCIDRLQGKCKWITSIDKMLVPTLAEMDVPILTEIAISPTGDKIAVGLPGAQVLEVRLSDGIPVQAHQLNSHNPIYAIAYENTFKQLWAMDDHYQPAQHCIMPTAPSALCWRR